MKLHIYQSADEVIIGLAEFFIQKVTSAIEQKGNCNVVLSGGSSPKKLYQLLSSEKYRHQVSWSKIFFFFGDERFVPFNDETNNGHMAKQTLFDPLLINPSSIFYINTALQPDEAAVDYSNRISQHFGDKPPIFDLILLGLGDNAHTASLFPYSTVLNETKQLVCAPYIEELAAYRITMTAPLINLADTIAFLVYGNNKAKAVYHVLKAEKNTASFPAQLINSETGTTHWFLDNLAASELISNNP
ncbi:MAG: 6-phosphogluconolactonase [Sphingobacteriales bacterium]|nr:MAG: 6-phosphogluconolactonase [Sphingobacteriales bacterium]